MARRSRPRTPPKPAPHAAPELDPETVAEASRRYWDGTETRKEIESSFQLCCSWHFARLVPARGSGQSCPHCGVELLWTTRRERDRSVAKCPSCRHKSGGCCGCEGCEREAEAGFRAAAEAWGQQYGSIAHLRAVLSQLTDSQRLVLSALAEVYNRSNGGWFSWADVASRAGVQQRWVDLAHQRFLALRLVFDDGRYIHVHPAALAMEFDLVTTRL